MACTVLQKESKYDTCKHEWSPNQQLVRWSSGQICHKRTWLVRDQNIVDMPFFNISMYAGKQRWPVCKVRKSQTEDYLIYCWSFVTCLGFAANLLLGFLPFVSNITEGVKKAMYLNCLLMRSVIRPQVWLVRFFRSLCFLLNPMCILSSKALKRQIWLASSHSYASFWVLLATIQLTFQIPYVKHLSLSLLWV
jgi:heme/copper-type cytochrome/quinol oxidase subunit 4